MRHLVDPLVVGVHERGAAGRELAHGRDEAGRRVPPMEVHPSEMRSGESGGAVVVAGDDRHQALRARERLEGLEHRRRHFHARVRASERPLQDVHDLAVEGHPITDDPVLGGHPSRHQGGQRAGRRARCDRCDRSSRRGRQHRRQLAALLELLCAEPVDHQEDDLARFAHRRREPGRQRRLARVCQLPEEPRHHTVEAGPVPVGQERHGLPGLPGPFQGFRDGCLSRPAVTHGGTPYDPRTTSTHVGAGSIRSCEGLDTG